MNKFISLTNNEIGYLRPVYKIYFDTQPINYTTKTFLYINEINKKDTINHDPLEDQYIRGEYSFDVDEFLEVSFLLHPAFFLRFLLLCTCVCPAEQGGSSRVFKASDPSEWRQIFQNFLLINH